LRRGRGLVQAGRVVPVAEADPVDPADAVRVARADVAEEVALPAVLLRAADLGVVDPTGASPTSQSVMVRKAST